MVFCGRTRPATVVFEDVDVTRGSSATSSSGAGSMEDYDDVCSLGKGSFGDVVKARHRATGKTIAIKSLRSTDGTTATTSSSLCMRRLLTEASAGNPYVVGSHGLVLDSITDNLCLAMEYVDGPNLSDFLSDRPPLEEDTVRAFMWQLLTGTKTMHERRIVHRDFKPANVLVREDEKTIKICDLGVAMSLATERPPYGRAGTGSYMAPEMLLRKPDYDARVDTWSLGCVMAEMLTGGKTLFEPRADVVRQVRSIFTVLGLPDGKWFTSRPLADMVARPLLSLPQRQGQRSRLRELFPVQTLSEDGFQVLKGLLTCNPSKRLTAAAALKLPWFRPPAPPRPVAAAKVSMFALLRKKVEAVLLVRQGCISATQEQRSITQEKCMVAKPCISHLLRQGSFMPQPDALPKCADLVHSISRGS